MLSVYFIILTLTFFPEPQGGLFWIFMKNLVGFLEGKSTKVLGTPPNIAYLTLNLVHTPPPAVC